MASISSSSLNQKSTQPEEPIIQEGAKLFNFSEARNYAAEKASNDMVSMPDCDEAWMRLDIEAINVKIKEGTYRLAYDRDRVIHDHELLIARSKLLGFPMPAYMITQTHGG
jgi:glycosyltransferase involved in cell wall biosynthesis